MLEVVLAVLAGVLIIDVVLDLWRQLEGVQRRRQLDRDRAEMDRTIARTGGRRG